MNSGFLQHLSDCGLLFRFSRLNVALWKSPVRRAFVFNKQIAHLALDISVHHSAAAAFVQTFKLVIRKIFFNINVFFDVVHYKSCALGSCYKNLLPAGLGVERGNHAPVKIANGVVYSQNK